MTSSPSRRAVGAAIAAGSVVAFIGFGFAAAFGVFLRPMSEELGWGREIFSLSLAIQGLFWGIELGRNRTGREADPESATEIRERLRADGVLLGITGPHENVVKIRPPLVFSPGDADRLIETLESALQWLH